MEYTGLVSSRLSSKHTRPGMCESVNPFCGLSASCSRLSAVVGISRFRNNCAVFFSLTRWCILQITTLAGHSWRCVFKCRRSMFIGQPNTALMHGMILLGQRRACSAAWHLWKRAPQSASQSTILHARIWSVLGAYGHCRMCSPIAGSSVTTHDLMWAKQVLKRHTYKKIW